MKDKYKTKDQLINELAELRQRIMELEASETQRKRAEEAQDKEPNYLRILAVDDDQTALDFYQEVLFPMRNLRRSESTTGDLEAKLSSNRFSKTSIPSFDVILCHRGDEAVETVRVAIEENKPFAVVFLDVRLPPGPDGVWTAEHIRALDPYLQIVMVTGYSDVDPVDIACRVPPMEKLFYIQKPLDPQEVRQFASALGAKWHAERQVLKIHAELRESEEKHRTLTESSLTGIFIHQDGKYVFVNDRFAEVHGYRTQELLGKEYWTLIHPDEKEGVKEIVSKRLKGKAVPQRYEVQRLRKDGETIWCEMMAACIEYGGKPAIMGNIIDITERKQAEEALRESEKKLRFLSSRLLTAQEMERRRVSIELHDELGQALTLLKIRLRFIERNLQTDRTGIRQDCEGTLRYIDQVIENVRRLSRDLRPSILDDLGLSAALRWLIDDFTKHYNIKTSLYMDDINDLSSLEAQITIYRIFQESFTNIVKHAQATRVSVAIRKQDGSVSFLVEDNGKGFDVEQAVGRDSTEKGLGLAAMDERARMLGGFLDIWSQEGKGTRITFTIPMDKGGG